MVTGEAEGGRSAEDGGAGDARDASRLLGRRGGHRAARGVEDVHTLETDLLVVFPLVALKFGVEAGIGEVGDALGDEHGGLDAVLQAGADGSGGGEHGGGAHARIPVRDVVDGHRAEVKLPHGLSNPRLRRCEGRGDRQDRDGFRRRRASNRGRSGESESSPRGKAARRAPEGCLPRRVSWDYPRVTAKGRPGRKACHESCSGASVLALCLYTREQTTDFPRGSRCQLSQKVEGALLAPTRGN